MATFFYDPEVALIGHSCLSPEGIERFLSAHRTTWDYHTEDEQASAIDLLEEFGGRICYMSFLNPGKKTNAQYLQHIIDSKHTSVLEHGVINFAIWGVSRALTHELVRHRVGASPSQLSQRYVDESVAEYVVPHLFQNDVDLQEYKNDIEEIHKFYLKWVERAQNTITRDVELNQLEGTERRKYARQAARYMLPNATETKLELTVNMRALRHILDIRCSKPADVEIRKLTYALFSEARRVAPNTFRDYTPVRITDGTFILEHDRP